MVYQIKVGYVYKFKFFNLIDFLNGPYKINNILIIDELVENNIDLFKHTFDKIGVSKEDYQNIVLPFIVENNRLYKLIDVHNVEKSYYIPEEMILEEPIHGVKPYLRLGLAVNLGIFGKPETIEWVKNEISDMLRGKLGIEKDAVIFASEEVWLTKDEYLEIEDNRKENIENSESIYLKNERLKTEISNLNVLIRDYEDTLISLQG